MQLKVKDVIKYLSRFNPEDDVFVWADEIDEYLPFQEDSLGTSLATRRELEEDEKSIGKRKYFKRTLKSKKEFKKWLKKEGYID